MTPAHRTVPKSPGGWLPLLGVSGFGAVLIAGLVAYHTFVSADTLEGLRSISIRPSTPEERTVNPGGTLRLTAMGDFATMEIPVRVDWSFVGEPLGSSLPDCTNTKQCTLHAGNTPGSVSIQAEVGSFTDTASIAIATTNPFTDDLPGWADTAILSLNQLGIIRGYDNGTYGPGDPVTRGQFVTLLYRLALHASMAEEPPPELCPPSRFADVPQEHFAFLPACFYDRTAVGGHTTNDFAPDLPAPREQVATLIARTYAPSLLEGHGITGDRANEPYERDATFDDVPNGHPAFFDVQTVWFIDIMTGYPNGDFGVGDELNRAQAAVIIERLLQQIDDYNIEEFWQLSSTGGDDEQEEDTDDGGSSLDQATVGCGVHNGTANFPSPPASAVGTNYARHDLPVGTYTDAQIRSACTQNIFEDLMEDYCNAGNTTPAIWRIVRYGQAVVSWQNTDPHPCP